MFSKRMKTCQIAEAKTSDIPALALLLGQLFILESDFQVDPGKQADGLRLIIENPELGCIFVLRSGEQIIGMVNVLRTISTAEGGPVLLLEDVIVADAYRGQGLGTMLVKHVLEWAGERGISRLTLLADRDNDPARQFYEKLGFRESAMKVYRYFP